MSKDSQPIQDERREAKRMPREESVSIQLISSCEDGRCRLEVAECTTLDVSVSGLRLLLFKPLEDGRIYDVCVQLNDQPKRFLLTGETRWCRCNAEQAGYEVGIAILPGEGTDFEVWASHLAQVG